MKKQQEVMSLYSQYGVSPMVDACQLMLLQFPIFLMALFSVDWVLLSFVRSFPLGRWPFNVWCHCDVPLPHSVLGNHLSLFCILMTVTSILNTKFTMSQQDTGQQQMAAMKWMMYLMPVMFLFCIQWSPRRFELLLLHLYPNQCSNHDCFGVE